MSRLVMVFTWLVLIVGFFFGISAGAYALGGVLEAHWFVGASRVSNILFNVLLGVMIPATLLTLAERKWSGLMQNRPGPNRARFFGLKNFSLSGVPHLVADVVKMLTKEAFTPVGANKVLFALGPMLAFAPVLALFAIVPAGPALTVDGHTVEMVVATPDFGLLYIFAIASLAVYGTSLAGWSSNNKFGLLGGIRASSQMVSYEVALGLSLVGMMIAFSTVQLGGPGGMGAAQGAYLWSFHLGSVDFGLPAWGFFLQPVGFILFFAAAFAETKRAPFDAPEGESEILGYFVEYSGMQFGMFMISEFVEVVVLGGVLVSIFFGGYHLPFGEEWLTSLAVMKEHPWLLGGLFGLTFWLKVVLVIYLQLSARWSFPRFRYDQIQTLGWKILLPMGLINLFVSGALILWDPALHALTLFGLLELAVIAFLIITPPRQVRQAQAHHAHHDDAHGAGHAALPASPH